MEWLLGIIALIFSGLFTISMQNRNRLNRHDVELAKLGGLDNKLNGLEKKLENAVQSFGNMIEKHENSEDRKFNDLQHTLNKMLIKIALITKKDPDEDIDG